MLGAGAAAGGTCGTYAGAGTGSPAPGLLNEPMGGGALETGAAGASGAGAGTGMSAPGCGGALALGGGRANWPISGTMLGTAAGTEGAAATGFAAAAEGPSVVRSLSARVVCTTASTHSVPQASAEERSRSDDRMVDGGVTSC